MPEKGPHEDILMHICNDCRWIGTAPEIFSSEESRFAILLSLTPGQPVPSGLCPKCSGTTIPVDLPALPVPEGFGKDEPFTGWRWNLSITQTRNALALYLSDRLTGALAEIAVDANGARPRLEITAFAKDTDVELAESQLLVSIGDGEVATFASAHAITQPQIYRETGSAAGAVMTRQEFLAVEDAAHDFG